MSKGTSKLPFIDIENWNLVQCFFKSVSESLSVIGRISCFSTGRELENPDLFSCFISFPGVYLAKVQVKNKIGNIFIPSYLSIPFWRMRNTEEKRWGERIISWSKGSQPRVVNIYGIFTNDIINTSSIYLNWKIWLYM